MLLHHSTHARHTSKFTLNHALVTIATTLVMTCVKPLVSEHFAYHRWLRTQAIQMFAVVNRDYVEVEKPLRLKSNAWRQRNTTLILALQNAEVMFPNAREILQGAIKWQQQVAETTLPARLVAKGEQRWQARVLSELKRLA